MFQSNAIVVDSDVDASCDRSYFPSALIFRIKTSETIQYIQYYDSTVQLSRSHEWKN